MWPTRWPHRSMKISKCGPIRPRKLTTLLKKQLDDVKKRKEEDNRPDRQFQLRHMGELPEHKVEVNLSTLGRLNQELASNSEHQMPGAGAAAAVAKTAVRSELGRSDVRCHQSRFAATSITTAAYRTHRTGAQEPVPNIRTSFGAFQGEIAAIEKALADTAKEAKLQSQRYPGW